MKRWSKKKTIISCLVALIAIPAIAVGAYAAAQMKVRQEPKAAPVVSQEETIPQPPPDITADEITAGVNAERVKAGLGALAVNQMLNDSACLKADDMVAKGYWAHVSPDGLDPWYWFRQVGYDYRWAAENLAYGYGAEEDVMKAWMDSPGHRANILNPDYTEQGACVRYHDNQNGDRTPLVVNHFGAR